jgi:hypothetical protein
MNDETIDEFLNRVEREGRLAICPLTDAQLSSLIGLTKEEIASLRGREKSEHERYGVRSKNHHLTPKA